MKQMKEIYVEPSADRVSGASRLIHGYVEPGTCIYKIVNLLKSYDNIHGMTYTTKIMLSGIAILKLGISIIRL